MTEQEEARDCDPAGEESLCPPKGHLLLGLGAVCCPHLRSHRCWWLHVMWIPQSSCVPLVLCCKVGSSPKGRQVWGSSPQEAASHHCCLHVVITGAMARLADTSRTSYHGRCKEMGQHKGGDILDQNSVTPMAKLSQMCTVELSVLKNNQNCLSAKGEGGKSHRALCIQYI